MCSTSWKNQLLQRIVNDDDDEISLLNQAQPVEVDSDDKLDRKQKTIQTFNIDAKGFRKIQNENALTRESEIAN